MKHTILALALVGLAFGCKSDQAASVADTESATVPAKAECTMMKECSAEAKAECATKAEGKKGCCPSQAKPQN